MRILIADDHGVVREGLKALIDNEAEWKWLVKLKMG